MHPRGCGVLHKARFVQPAELELLTRAHNAWWARNWKGKSGVQFSLDPDGTLSVAERLWR